MQTRPVGGRRSTLRLGVGILLLAGVVGAACGDDDDGALTCGDAVLDAGELCDDGDDDPANGCDPACQPIPGEVWHRDWTAQDEQFFVNVIAADGDGRTFLAGDRGDSGVVIALAADGEELWRTAVTPAIRAIASDASGGCIVQSAGLARFDASGKSLWTVDQPGHPEGMVVDGDAVHVLSTVNSGPLDSEIRLRSLVVGDGSLRWDHPLPTPDSDASGLDLTLVGSSLVALGTIRTGDFIVLADPASGATNPPRLLAKREYHEVIHGLDGDLLALRRRDDPPSHPAALQRIGLDGTTQWTHEFPDLSLDIGGLVVGPAGSLVATGTVSSGDPRVVVMSMGADGKLLWTIEHVPDAPSNDTYGVTAIGPGFLAVAGLDYSYTHENYTLDRVWVRRYGT